MDDDSLGKVLRRGRLAAEHVDTARRSLLALLEEPGDAAAG
ncbi:hypothetical protein ACWEQL_03435 [Kitasatospora sp. NPDC004240]